MGRRRVVRRFGRVAALLAADGPSELIFEGEWTDEQRFGAEMAVHEFDRAWPLRMPSPLTLVNLDEDRFSFGPNAHAPSIVRMEFREGHVSPGAVKHERGHQAWKWMEKQLRLGGRWTLLHRGKRALLRGMGFPPGTPWYKTGSHHSQEPGEVIAELMADLAGGGSPWNPYGDGIVSALQRGVREGARKRP